MGNKTFIPLMIMISCLGYITISTQAIYYINQYSKENAKLRAELIILNETYRVSATMYQPLSYQTDSTPNELADGTIIDIHKAHEYRYVALSRDLLKRWGGPFDYGDYIKVEGAGEHSGIWQVRDTMHRRWTNKIDFLMSPNHKPFKYDEVVIRSQKQN
jgi:3D (Asp-Asp-Asp) domain-containing protein